MASVTEELNFMCYLILINLYLHSHGWLRATLFDSGGLEYFIGRLLITSSVLTLIVAINNVAINISLFLAVFLS